MMNSPVHNVVAAGDDTTEGRHDVTPSSTVLTMNEKARLATQAKTMMETLLEATDFLGGMQWCLVHEKHKSVSLYRVQCSPEHPNNAPCNVHAVSKFSAEIDEVAESLITTTSESYKKMMAVLSSDFVDGAVLHTIVEPNEQTPYRFVALKWAAFKSTTPFGKDHDCIILEYVDMIEDDQGQKVTFRVMQSVDLPNHHELAPSSKYTRDIVPLMGFMYHTTSHDGELRMTYTCNFCSDDDMPAWAANSAILSHVEKAITGVVKYIETFRASKDEQDLVLPQQVLTMSEQDHCFICKKSFGVLRRRHNCFKCGENICSRCSALRTATVPDIGERQLRVCTPCVLSARRSSKPQNVIPESCGSSISTAQTFDESDTLSLSDLTSFHGFPQQNQSRGSFDDVLESVRSRLIEYKDFSESSEGITVPKADFPARSFSDGLVHRKASLFRARRRGSPADLAISLEAFRQHQMRMGNNDPQQPEEDSTESEDEGESMHCAPSFSSSGSSCSSGRPSSVQTSNSLYQDHLSPLTSMHPNLHQVHGSVEDQLTMRIRALQLDHARPRRRHHHHHDHTPSRVILNEAMERHQSIMEATSMANALAQQVRKVSHHRVTALQREHQALLDICGVNNQEEDQAMYCYAAAKRMGHPTRQVSDGVVRYKRDRFV